MSQTIILISGLLLSLGLNTFLLILLIKEKDNLAKKEQEFKSDREMILQAGKQLEEKNQELTEKLKEESKKEDSYEVKELLRDLTTGAGYVKITRLDPDDFYIRKRG